MECKECRKNGVKKCYVGETGRELKIRCKEHMYKAKDMANVSDVYMHGEKEPGSVKLENWEVSIVRKEKKEFDRRYFEAKEIINDRSAFNKSNGIIIL